MKQTLNINIIRQLLKTEFPLQNFENLSDQEVVETFKKQIRRYPQLAAVGKITFDIEANFQQQSAINVIPFEPKVTTNKTKHILNDNVVIFGQAELKAAFVQDEKNVLHIKWSPSEQGNWILTLDEFVTVEDCEDPFALDAQSEKTFMRLQQHRNSPSSWRDFLTCIQAVNSVLVVDIDSREILAEFILNSGDAEQGILNKAIESLYGNWCSEEAFSDCAAAVANAKKKVGLSFI